LRRRHNHNLPRDDTIDQQLIQTGIGKDSLKNENPTDNIRQIYGQYIYIGKDLPQPEFGTAETPFYLKN
jgi:hypothetical protein